MTSIKVCVHFLGPTVNEQKKISFEICIYAVRDLAVCNHSRYSDWLRAGRPRGRSSSPGKDKNVLHVVQTLSRAPRTASSPMGTGGSFPGGKADHSPPTSTEVKKT
jgi:hypothetical protein